MSGFGAQFPVAERGVRAWHADGASAGEIATQLGAARGDVDEPDSLRADGVAFQRVDPDVFGPILDGSVATGFDADVPIATPGVLLVTDPAIGGRSCRATGLACRRPTPRSRSPPSAAQRT